MHITWLTFVTFCCLSHWLCLLEAGNEVANAIKWLWKAMIVVIASQLLRTQMVTTGMLWQSQCWGMVVNNFEEPVNEWLLKWGLPAFTPTMLVRVFLDLAWKTQHSLTWILTENSGTAWRVHCKSLSTQSGSDGLKVCSRSACSATSSTSCCLPLTVWRLFKPDSIFMNKTNSSPVTSSSTWRNARKQEIKDIALERETFAYSFSLPNKWFCNYLQCTQYLNSCSFSLIVLLHNMLISSKSIQ